jgi:poly(3-hydroxybutyrate) depolymerase
MAHRWATESSTELRGIVAISGADDPSQSVTPRPEPIRVLQIHGDADDVVSHRGGRIIAPYPPARETLARWRRRNRCTAPEAERRERDDLFDRLTLTETWTCGANRTALWTVQGGGHYLTPTPKATVAVLDFLEGR